MDKAYQNTDKELWRQPVGDYGDKHGMEPYVFVTKDGGIGFNHYGTCVVRTIKEWVKMATTPLPEAGESEPAFCPEDVMRHPQDCTCIHCRGECCGRSKPQPQAVSECKHKNWKNVCIKEAVICAKCDKIIGEMNKVAGEGVEDKPQAEEIEPLDLGDPIDPPFDIETIEVKLNQVIKAVNHLTQQVEKLSSTSGSPY